MMTVQEIKERALKCGACELIEGADTIADLVALMGTPQGREFCKKCKFPTLDILRQHKAELVAMNVFVDSGNVDIENRDNVIIAGETTAVLRYTSTDKPYHAMVMHGAKAKVIAYGYALCQVVNINGEVETHESKNANIFVR